jgi:glycosyltransferase involved in cell wall biosynthesis
MQILLVNQFFHPDSTATSQLLTDLASHLASEGHSVRVICGRSSCAAPDSMPPPPVRIIRTPSLPFSRGFLGRILSYSSFFSTALCRGLLGPAPDLVLTLTTPPALCLIGSLLKAAKGSRHFIWEMDVYPDIAVDLKVLDPRSWFTRLLGASLDASRRNADGIIALGDCMRDRLIRHGIPHHKIKVAENWADSQEIYPLPFPGPDPLRILYAGNLGLAHDVDTVRAVIHLFRADSRLHFTFVGGGPQRHDLEAFCRAHEIPNVSFTGSFSPQEIAGSLGACHVGLVTQKPAALGSLVPCKTYSLMAAGRPILYIGPREATPARIIHRFRCGWQIDPGDSATLAGLLEYLAANPNVVRAAGARSHEAFLGNYQLALGVARIASILGAAQPMPAPETAAVDRTLPDLPNEPAVV